MIEPKERFDVIIRRCRLAIERKYRGETRFRARPVFDAEIRLILDLGFEETLIQIVNFMDELRRIGVAFHLVGSGGSSLVLYLLGFSQVDPVRYHTYAQRLWLTANKQPPLFQIQILPDQQINWEQILRPSCVSVNPMTELESIPARIEQRLSHVWISFSDPLTFESLHSGDTDGVFQLDSPAILRLMSQIRPTRIEGLTLVTVLNQIEGTNPDLAREVAHHFEVSNLPDHDLDQSDDSSVKQQLPLLYQETIMSMLRSHAGLHWNDTYQFVRESAKGHMTERHELWNRALNTLEHKFGGDGQEMLRQLVAASRWALCLAHYAANAITSYKAAFFRTHHREEFEQIRREITFTRAWGNHG